MVWSIFLPVVRNRTFIICAHIQQYTKWWFDMAIYDSDPGRHEGEDAPEQEPTKSFTRHKVGESLTKAGFGDVLVLSHEAADRVLTPARREIIHTLSNHDVSSLRELAEFVDRNPGNLSRDMTVLVAEDIVRYESEGKAKRPELKHDTIIQEPLVASENPLPDSLEM